MFREEVVGLEALDRLADVLETLDPEPELIVEVGVIRRHIGLPQSMAALQPRRARFGDDVLVVDLA